MDDHGYAPRWAGRRQKSATYASKAKEREMERSQLLAKGATHDPQAALRKPFRTPTVVSSGAQTRPAKFVNQGKSEAKSELRTPKSESASEDEETRPSTVKPQSCSSDEEENERRARNDIPATNFTSEKNGSSRTSGRTKTCTFKKIPGRFESSQAACEPDHKQRSSETSAYKIKAEKPYKNDPTKSPIPEEDEPRKFRIPKLSAWDEAEDETASSRARFKKASRTPTPELLSEKRRFLMPVKTEGSDDDQDEQERERRKALKRAAILREVGGSPNKIKRTLIDAGLGEGLDGVENNDIWRSPPKKIAPANQGLSSLAARIASRRIKEEQQQVKEEQADGTDIFQESGQASCPMCHKLVSSSLLMTFSNHRPRSLNTRQQAAFCVHHKRDSALTTYTSHGYPDVDWDLFTSRLSRHYTYISSLITSPASTPSHYRPLFASDIKHGRNRTLKQSIMGAKGEGSSTARILIPGYYGPRGAQAIQQALMLKFNGELRKAAVEDHVVSARAVGGYVASVLVPELGTRLIMEDMKIGEEEARSVMEKSAGLGSLVNEELKDVRSEADKSIIEEGEDYD